MRNDDDDNRSEDQPSLTDPQYKAGERTVSAARLKANQENAQKSTGPTSKAGKTASRLNAIQHGLLSETPILPGEDDAQRAALHERMVEDLAPVGAFEEELVAKIASAMWRLRRFERIETALYAYRLLEDCRQDGMNATKPIVIAQPLDIPGMVAPRPDSRRRGDAHRHVGISHGGTRLGTGACVSSRP